MFTQTERPAEQFRRLRTMIWNLIMMTDDTQRIFFTTNGYPGDISTHLPLQRNAHVFQGHTLNGTAFWATDKTSTHRAQD